MYEFSPSEGETLVHLQVPIHIVKDRRLYELCPNKGEKLIHLQVLFLFLAVLYG